jgi:hypothetical protein
LGLLGWQFINYAAPRAWEYDKGKKNGGRRRKRGKQPPRILATRIGVSPNGNLCEGKGRADNKEIPLKK